MSSKDYNQQIEQLYLRMFQQLFVYARSNLGNSSLAEEAVQETFRIACQKPKDLCDSEQPAGWLFNTLKYVLANMQRSRAAANNLLSEYLTTHLKEIAVTENRIGFEILYENVAELEEFKLIKEIAIDGKSYLEMAQSRGISVEACRKRVQRAKEVLRKKI